MRKWRKTTLYVLILCLLLAMTACQKKDESISKQPKDEFKILETPLEELETGLLEVMSKADLVPYYEKQIAAKKHQEEEQKQATPPSGGAGQTPTAPPKEEYKSEPATINDTLLTDIVVNEKTQKEEGVNEEEKPLPDEIVFIWDDINTSISKLHEQWNDLEPKLIGVNVSETALTDFGNALNKLTIAGTSKQFMETLTSANEATGQFGEFMKASKDQAQPPLYFIKYHTREIVLTAANNDFPKANEHFQALRSQVDTLGNELAEKKNVKDQFAKLRAAVDDLESALRVQDLNLLKVKASVVTKDITSIKEKLAEE